MKRTTIMALLLSSALAATAASAQQATAPNAVAPNICQGLVAFLAHHGGVQGNATPITLEEAQRFARENNSFACGSAIHSLYAAGVRLPDPLLAAIGVPPSTNTRNPY